jgi:hypothetical protein
VSVPTCPPAASRRASATRPLAPKLGARPARNRREVKKYHPNTLDVMDYNQNCAAAVNLPCGNIADSNGTGCGLYDLAQRLCSGGSQASRCGAKAQNFVYYDYVGCHPEPWSGSLEQGHVFNIAVPPVRRSARPAPTVERAPRATTTPCLSPRKPMPNLWFQQGERLRLVRGRFKHL